MLLQQKNCRKIAEERKKVKYLLKAHDQTTDAYCTIPEPEENRSDIELWVRNKTSNGMKKK